MTSTSEKKATFWDRRSRGYDARVRKHGSSFEKTMTHTRSLLNATDVVLDFACASGEMSLDIAPHVRRVQGIDLSVKMIELANRKQIEQQVQNVAFETMEAFDARLVPGSFQAVVAFNIFHLLDDPPRVLARLNDLLATGGLLISKTPCLGEWNGLLRLLIVLAQRVGWAPTIRSLTVLELEELVSGSFEIVETRIWDEKDKVQWIVARKV